MDATVTKTFEARHRFARITARKARRVAEIIRGKSVNEALEVLQFTPQRGATFYLRLLKSAVANASQDEEVNVNHLVISQIKADDGPLVQNRIRFRPGPQGRVRPWHKRTCHLTIRVDVAEMLAAPKAKPAKASAKRSTKAPAATVAKTEKES
ncbi:MAG: 50S ribosomal protein L22 [Planctomycetes bacterium]|nr:50S ribosomal protein L22 [Planctomycetota bacterium]